MNESNYAVPKELGRDLSLLHEYWDDLKRGYGLMPYWDDIQLSQLPDLSDRLFLLDQIEQKERFRFRSAGSDVVKAYDGELVGYFLDRIPSRSPLDKLAEQIAATLEKRAPTYYQHVSMDEESPGYARLLLPLWGSGRIEMILGGFDEL